MTDQLRKQGFDSIGIDISNTAILKAKKLFPSSNFEVKNYNDFDCYSIFNPDIIIMAELTWYILDSLDLYLSDLKNFFALCSKPIFLIHLLATYKKGTQKYGLEKFSTYDEVLKYFDLKYIESGFISTNKVDYPDSQNTYFVAHVNPLKGL